MSGADRPERSRKLPASKWRRGIPSCTAHAGVILPCGHLGHVGERLLLGKRPQLIRFFSHLPLHHTLEPFVEWLQVALLIDTVLAVRARFDGHATALATM